MRSSLILGFCLVLLLPAIATAHYTHGVGDAFALVRVTDEAGPSLQDAGLYLVAEVPEGYLAFLDAPELAYLMAAGVPIEVLVEKDDKSLEYLIAFEHDHDHPLADPHPAAKTLYQGDGYRIMAVPATLIAEQPNCVPEIQRVFRRPLSFVRRPWPEPASGDREVVVEPAIANAIADITQPPLEDQVQTLQDFVTRHSQYNGGYLASLWIRDRFLSYGYTDVTLHDYNSWNDNVVCVKPGTVFPDEYIVIGAHYDSINYSNNSDAPGADDNATGSVAVLEAARVLAGIDFERTIVFICFSGEEEGLVGSDAWAGDAAAAGMDIIGMINLDMICYRVAGDTEDLDIISNGASQQMADLAFEAIAAYVPELATVEGYLVSGTSDHAAFWSHGFRAIFLFEDSGNYSPYLHTASDVMGLSANDFPFMLKNVKAATATLGVLARPFHVAISHVPQGNSEEYGPFELTAEIVSAEPLDTGSLELLYRTDGGGFVSLPLLPSGGPDEYAATIPAQVPGTHVEYYLKASDLSGNTSYHPDQAPATLHDFRVGINFVLREDGETGGVGWTLGVPGDDADTGHWILADPVGTAYQSEYDHTPDPGTMCFVTGNANPGDASGTNDVDGGQTTLLSPVFDLSDALWAGISYWRWYTDETNHDDDFFVDISNNAGQSWIELELVTDSAYPWVKAEFEDIASIIPLTDQMQLRFIAEDRNSGSLVEALIDDLEIFVVSDDLSGVEAAPALAARLDAYPNPFNPTTRFRFVLPETGQAELRVFDAQGAEAARLWSGRLEAGEHELVWDASGHASGVYLARLTQNGFILANEKLTLLK